MAAPRRVSYQMDTCLFTADADRLLGIESQSPSSQKKRNTSSSMCDTQCLKQNNPKKYKAYLDEQKIRSKAYRDEVNSDQEKLQALREKAKLRQKKFREKKLKECVDNNCAKTSTPGQDNSTSKGPRTRAESVNQRQKWREAKRKYREKLSTYEKMWIKRKDKERKTN
ncbi:hypothetical protein MAR_019253 [Mya arenaria]|uniref:Uncharacterized protein n=1 Tax=Mya arenaria TaxID=6604 RepID=A0ABY7EJI1_MYAAR|nr:hypothetical protein MAR_019253 [Mya arenaria]